jgi:hypothetical protein
MIEPSQMRPAFIFGYSTIFPAAWISICLLFALLIPGQRLGIVGTALLFMGAASLISWVFAKRHRRHFTKEEYWKIILYCYLWAVSLESFVLFTVVVLPQIEAGNVDMKPLAFAVPFMLSLDALFVWLAFRQAGRKTIDAYLAKTV